MAAKSSAAPLIAKTQLIERKLTPTLKEQGVINALFHYFLRQGTDSIAPDDTKIQDSKFIALAHRVADGTLVRYLRK